MRQHTIRDMIRYVGPLQRTAANSRRARLCSLLKMGLDFVVGLKLKDAAATHIPRLSKMSSTGLQPPRWAGAQQLLLPYLSTWTIEKVQTLRCGPLDAWFQHFPLLGEFTHTLSLLLAVRDTSMRI
jgi:hypothetical protein